ncbi:Ku protein [Streptomyces sp. V3I7]|uniref:non-homologous end joining protein Ku n=1 Tax=Streptomyces sp. V3I7 TaxID=3042278 RepID=UPI002783F278|nr:Ku protein [Streptomyces sp. V3I7]MDQ0994718.1 DNA end-binding protein Ku [Streptomyces sp. V3I7]
MTRAIWSGAISFGLVTVPVQVATATADHSVRFHQYHLSDQGRIRYRKVCELEDREIPEGEIGKGYELTKARIIPISDEELHDLPLPTARAIEIVTFVSWASIDPIRIGEGYYLAAREQLAAKPYRLLVEALRRSSRVAVVKWAWHGRERLGLLRVREDALVMHVMHWPDEIRDPSELVPPPVEVSDAEIDGALTLMDAMAVDSLEGPEFGDRYTEALEQVIDAKREDRPPPEAPEPAAGPGTVLDLMAALQESVAKAQAARGEAPEQKRTAARKRPAKKTAPTRRGS